MVQGEVDESTAAQLLQGVVDLTDLPEPLPAAPAIAVPDMEAALATVAVSAVAMAAVSAVSENSDLPSGEANMNDSTGTEACANSSTSLKEMRMETGVETAVGTPLVVALQNQLQATASLLPPSAEEERATSMED